MPSIPATPALMASFRTRLRCVDFAPSAAPPCFACKEFITSSPHHGVVIVKKTEAATESEVAFDKNLEIFSVRWFQ
jgi:hypothetical protein